jgi:S1-C subfamily serine protease
VTLTLSPHTQGTVLADKQAVRSPAFCRRRQRILVIMLVAAALILAGCDSSGPGATARASTTTTPTSAPGPTTTTASSSGSTTTRPGSAAPVGGVAAAAVEQAFVAVVAKVRPQVVQISTSSGLGSGVIYDSKGDIVTNNHVVGNATTFKVQLVNGQSLNATLVGAYPPDDLAVIRASGARHLDPATFGDSGALQVGDIVFAIGNPLGLASSVTEGIVSYNGRTVSEGNGVELPNTVQTSAAINPGNSGGALANLNAEVVGIPTLAAVDQQEGGAAAGIGFAIPANTVKQIVPQLIATGHVANSGRAALGIAGSDSMDASGNPAGVIVSQATPGGGAARAGIVAGDVITAINGKPVTSLADLQNILAGLSPGATANVTVVTQGGATKTVPVTLGQLAG